MLLVDGADVMNVQPHRRVSCIFLHTGYDDQPYIPLSRLYSSSIDWANSLTL